jgi:hypothetical protein
MSSIAPVRTILLVALATAAGCNEYNPTSFHTTDAPRDATAPRIAVNPTFVDFGVVSALTGESRRSDVTVTNLGDEPLTLTGLSLEDLDFSMSSFQLGQIGSTVLEPGGSTTFTVTFAPQELDGAAATVRVESDDPLSPTVVVDVVGNSAAPVINVSPEVYDFGGVAVGCEGELTVTVTNDGQEQLTVDEVELVTASDALDLAVAGLPWQLAPGAVQTFQVGYAPPDDIPDSAMIRVISNDPARPELLANMTGAPPPAVSQLDRFVQGGKWDKVDIMLTVSEYFTCPSSMADEMAQLLGSASTVLDALNDSGLDYEIMVTTSLDGCHNDQIITRDTPNAVAAFQDALYGHSLSPNSLEVAVAGLSRTGAGDCNEDFGRPEALLKVISIADTDDVSSQAVSYYTDQMSALVPGVIYSTVSGPPPSACSPYAWPATRLEEAANNLFGVQMSICDANWTDHIVDIVLDFAGGIEAPESGAFDLTNEPVPSSIEVFVDGAPSVDWTYDATANTVVFNEGTWPLKLSVIDVTYDLLADCDQ